MPEVRDFAAARHKRRQLQHRIAHAKAVQMVEALEPLVARWQEAATQMLGLRSAHSQTEHLLPAELPPSLASSLAYWKSRENLHRILMA
jgi:hypothetical protein